MKIKRDLLRLYINFVKNHRKLAPDTYQGMSVKNMEKYLKDTLKSYSLEKLYFENTLIGFCIYYVAKVPFSSVITMYIGDFAIAPKFQHKGYGKKLMEIMEKIAKKKKCNNISLVVHANNNKAISFYRGFNFYESRYTLEKEL